MNLRKSDAAAGIEVTVAIAGYNCEAFLEQAVSSALAQEIRLEVIIVDDASSDGTAELAERLVSEDNRVRLIRMPTNVGPAGARNAAIDAARGKWFAILDADDFMHSGRLRMLVDLAEDDNADLIADDMIVFDDANRKPPERFLRRHASGTSEWISLSQYLRSTKMYDSAPNLGYLKPLIRLSRLREAGLRYDESLRIGEDDHFIFAMLLAGFRYRLEVISGYYYRKHASSISHRLSPETIDRIATVAEQMQQKMIDRTAEERRAFADRACSVHRTTSFVHLLEHLKAHRWWSAAMLLGRNPAIIPLLRQPPVDRFKRWLARRASRPAPIGQILVVTLDEHRSSAHPIGCELRRLGLTPLFLFIREKMPPLLARTWERIASNAAYLSAFGADATRNGQTTSAARLTLLRLSRQVEHVVIAPGMPYPFEKEIADSSCPVTRMDGSGQLRHLLAEGKTEGAGQALHRFSGAA